MPPPMFLDAPNKAWKSTSLTRSMSARTAQTRSQQQEKVRGASSRDEKCLNYEFVRAHDIWRTGFRSSQWLDEASGALGPRDWGRKETRHRSGRLHSKRSASGWKAKVSSM